MKLVNKKLRVIHIPQVPMKGFCVEVNNEREAFLIEQTLANQHLFLYKNGIIDDYANVICIEMFEDNEWQDYYNKEEAMEWEEFVETYEDYVNNGLIETTST